MPAEERVGDEVDDGGKAVILVGSVLQRSLERDSAFREEPGDGFTVGVVSVYDRDFVRRRSVLNRFGYPVGDVRVLRRLVREGPYFNRAFGVSGVRP